MTVRTSYEKNLIKTSDLRTFLYASVKLGSQLSYYVGFVREKRVCKKKNFFSNRSKDVLVAHYCIPCLASCDKDRHIDAIDKESLSVRQGQTFMRGRQEEKQRVTRTDLYMQ